MNVWLWVSAMLVAWVIAFVFCAPNVPCQFHFPEPVRYYHSIAECQKDVSGAPGDFDRNTMTGSEIACIQLREKRTIVAKPRRGPAHAAPPHAPAPVRVARGRGDVERGNAPRD